MQYMIQDLEDCDVVRTEMITMKANLKNQAEMVSQKDKIIKNLQGELSRLQNYNDSLSVENIQLQISMNKETASLRKSRNWWVATAIAGVLSGVFIHMHWKYGDGPINP
tara:strand:+ start:713 stop:1039 length:327 start_codon:yes stop_codon:yes gene_type:complete